MTMLLSLLFTALLVYWQLVYGLAQNGAQKKLFFPESKAMVRKLCYSLESLAESYTKY